MSKKYFARTILILSVLSLITIGSWQEKVEHRARFYGSVDAMNDVQTIIENS